MMRKADFLNALSMKGKGMPPDFMGKGGEFLGKGGDPFGGKGDFMPAPDMMGAKGGGFSQKATSSWAKVACRTVILARALVACLTPADLLAAQKGAKDAFFAAQKGEIMAAEKGAFLAAHKGGKDAALMMLIAQKAELIKKGKGSKDGMMLHWQMMMQQKGAAAAQAQPQA